ncbi:MAG TPA: protein-disulfide reductase DsbD, partial [Burkholderiaceae bacterium]|nr:protein-disulfide reductase DsbD [Burkholderiaceae bacterium]
LAGLALWAGVARAQEFLPFDQAFQFEARFVDEQHIEVRWTIAPDYYLYHDRIAFETEGGGALGPAQLPQGIVKFDENFGKDMHMHRGELVARIPVLALDAQGAVQLVATSQGCADAGLCYPPTQQRARLKPGGQDAWALALDAAAPQGLWSAPPGQGFDAAAQALSEPSSARSIDQDPGRIEAALREGASWRVVLLFVLLGLLLSFTPCVLPMVPILSSIIAGQQKTGHAPMTHAKGFTLALTYTLGMALVYTALGVAAGLAGEGLAARLQTPLVLGTFAVLMGLLALSMFGLYELQLPVALQSRLARLAGRQQAGVYVGAFIMGAISALIVGPCVAAPLAAALIYISQTGDVVLGGMALFAMALGMSVPLLLVGASAGFLLPRAGAWMESVRKFFGALLLAVALWMVAPIVPAWALMLAWAGLFIVGAAYLSVFDPLPVHASGWRRLWKGVGVLLAVAGTILILGVATGGRDVLQPLA